MQIFNRGGDSRPLQIESESHLGGGANSKSYSLDEGNSNTAEEFKELMNRANVGSKASRNVLNDVNRKAGGEIQEQIELGKFIRGIGKKEPVEDIKARTDPPEVKTTDLDRMVAEHTRNKVKANPKPIERRTEKLDPFE